MAAATQPARHFGSERERLRRRHDRHVRLATDRALTEVAFMLRAGGPRPGQVDRLSFGPGGRPTDGSGARLASGRGRPDRTLR
jgi:hypothetical protein